MRIVLGIFLLISTLLLFGEPFFNEEQSGHFADKSILPVPEPETGYSKKAIAWADSLLKKMSIDEKVGQLFMVSAYSNRDTAHEKEIADAIKNYHVGGLIFFQGGPVRQARLTNKYQEMAKVPLYIGMDAEWGLSMRIDSTVRYPKQMALGAVQNDTLIEKMGIHIAKECRRLGVHINFGPVADVNNNSANPVINIRSFGENKDKVVKKAIAYYKGMKKENVMACAKHFPGHGDTETDSHIGLPVINHSKERLDTLELFAFKKLFEAGIPSVMVGHMSIPSLDETPNLSSVFSKKIVTELMQQKMRFKGLVFTDALGMQGALTIYERGEVEVQAFLAGNDVLLCPDSLGLAFNAMKTAVIEGRISKERLEYSVKAILLQKYTSGLYKKQPIKETNLVADLNDNKHKALA
ncbi:MAG TPA: glycoside hydrolase family 3 N-terminal domain-containing protein, partial [Flavobacteriales bacterium]|nr:glycoside hydrolase family 3 N-terminal domain-containing protein [Flavobacteriales bacterium]